MTSKIKIFTYSLFFYFLSANVGYAVQEKEEQSLSMVVELARKNNFNSANKLLDLLSEKYSDVTWQIRIDFVAGFLALSQNNFSACIELFNKISGKEYPVSDYGAYFLSQCYGKAGEYKKAILILENFGISYPYTSLIPEASLNKARYLISSGNLISALEELNLFITKFPNHSKIPDAWFLKGTILEELGEKIAAYESYKYIYYLHPEKSIANSALKKIITISLDSTLKIEIPDLSLRIKRADILIKKRKYTEAIKDLNDIINMMEIGKEQEQMLVMLSLSYIKTRQHDKAITAISTHLKNYPSGVNAAEATYMLGNMLWNNENPEEALQTMNLIIRNFPDSKWALKAAFISARILEEEEGSVTRALEAYASLIKNVQDRELKEAAIWRTGWIYYKNREYKKTIDFFSEIVSALPHAASSDRLLYWIGKGAEQIGDKSLALLNYEKLTGFPFSYYSTLGQERIEKLKEITTTPQKKWSKKPDEGKSADDFLSMEKELEEVLNLSDKETENRIKKVLELIEIGFNKEANKEITILKKEVFNDSSSKKMLLSMLYEKAKNYNKAFRIRDNILNSMSDTQKNMSTEFWENFFPLSYWQTLSSLSEKKGVDPFLVLSVIRQESAYNPEAISIANARGLMQIMPATGKKLYKELLWNEKFDEETLFDPEVNLTLGIYYLKSLINKYDDNLILAIAAYNAGPIPVKKWIEKNKNIPADEFIENISYPETRDYVKAVLKNYENYKRIYFN